MARCKSAVANQTVFSDRYLLGLLVIKHTSWGGVNRHCDTKCYALSGSTCCRSAAKAACSKPKAQRKLFLLARQQGPAVSLTSI